MSTVFSLSDSDSEDDIPSSPSSLTSLPSTANPIYPLMDIPSCFPPVFDSVTLSPSVKDKRRFYNVYSGDQCGCFRDWADASGRVSCVKGNWYKAYDTWEEALDGWRQNCHSYYCHPADFVDRTLFISETTVNVPEATVAPPSQHNVVFLPASAPQANSTSSSLPSTHTMRSLSPASPSKLSSRGSASSHSRTALRHWAVSTTGFSSVVSTSQASRLFDEAVAARREVDMCEISSFDEALDWFNRLSLAS
ncbi:hypothetical protein BT96DRAFT_1005355 [Gymnopus androsaceus JB14]|uniref:Ribonuclease H1 N-terminal domain-containing protein n=1 Tax=Gymnopus androsaceus JB14 TaxID=1447944 RepID=A0A6A4GN70_9AGAR|nr:hypothetical protein BT96DRAFT_1005355 [Gymnopus androsaceus JB14]